MEKFKTFSKPFTSNRGILWMARKFNPSKRYVKELFPFTRRIKPNLIHRLYAAALLGYLCYWLLKLIPEAVRPRLHRFGYFVETLAAVNAFEDPEVSDLIR